MPYLTETETVYGTVYGGVITGEITYMTMVVTTCTLAAKKTTA